MNGLKAYRDIGSLPFVKCHQMKILLPIHKVFNGGIVSYTYRMRDCIFEEMEIKYSLH
jgi:hypothetical protein